MTLPISGQPPGGTLSFIRPVMHWKDSWRSLAPTTLRRKANLSAILAIRGRCSQIWIPGTLVRIGENSPRISEGASIFKSNMSWWGGPPGRYTRMMALLDFPWPCAPSACSNCGKVSPPKPSPPRRRNERRDRPSQKLPALDPEEIVNISKRDGWTS